MLRVLLTVPHTRCPVGVGGHPCDIGALSAAEDLRRSLEEGGAVVVLAVGDVARTECDLNRVACRQQPFRRRVRVSAPSLVLDIHSFPPEEARGNYAPHEVVLLDDVSPVTQLSRWLLLWLQERGVDVRLLRGARNDVQDEFQERRVPALLLEWNEGLGAGRREQIAQSVADAVLSFFS